jgi:hypothetical protein
MIKELFSFIWENSPWWLKYPMLILGTPTALTLAFLSWHNSSIHAAIRPYEEKRDIEINAMDKRLQSMDSKLDILIMRGH